ncbi:MAG: YfgM family protein [bacterium]
MSTYQTEEEQVEAIKKWWKDNGKSVIGGVALGLAVVGGLKGWQQYTEGKAETAAAYYTSFAVTAQGDDAQAALEQGKRLISEYGDSAYAVFSALQMAKIEYRQGNIDGAVLNLKWVAENAPDEPLKALANLRLTKVLVDKGDYEAAMSQAKVGDQYFAAEYAVILGDIAVASDDSETARNEYQRALELNVPNAELVRIKLANLGG